MKSTKSLKFLKKIVIIIYTKCLKISYTLYLFKELLTFISFDYLSFMVYTLITKYEKNKLGKAIKVHHKFYCNESCAKFVNYIAFNNFSFLFYIKLIKLYPLRFYNIINIQ